MHDPELVTKLSLAECFDEASGDGKYVPLVLTFQTKDDHPGTLRRWVHPYVGETAIETYENSDLARTDLRESRIDLAAELLFFDRQ